MRYEYRDWVETEVVVVGDGDVRFSAAFAQFEQPVRIADCTIVQLDLYATYFLAGLKIENCRVLCDIVWQSGGHNKRPIRVVDSEFVGFVDVEDCFFQAEVILCNVKFHGGTNLLGNVGTPVEVSFEQPLHCESVEGPLDTQTYTAGPTDPAF